MRRLIPLTLALLFAVALSGPAARAGITPFRMGPDGDVVPGDVIVAVDDQPVNDLDELLAQFERRNPGDTVTLTLWREGRTRKQATVLGKPE